MTILLGDLVAGILTASYGGHMTAILETWKVTDRNEWKMLAAHPPPDPMTDIDLNWWTIEGLADLGGNAFHYAGEAEITGVRVKPPPLGPFEFHQTKKNEEKKVTLQEPDGSKQPGEDEKEKRPPSKRRVDRSKSCTRYEEFREINKEPKENAGQHRSVERRGRSRVPKYLR